MHSSARALLCQHMQINAPHHTLSRTGRIAEVACSPVRLRSRGCQSGRTVVSRSRRKAARNIGLSFWLLWPIYTTDILGTMLRPCGVAGCRRRFSASRDRHCCSMCPATWNGQYSLHFRRCQRLYRRLVREGMIGDTAVQQCRTTGCIHSAANFGFDTCCSECVICGGHRHSRRCRGMPARTDPAPNSGQNQGVSGESLAGHGAGATLARLRDNMPTTNITADVEATATAVMRLTRRASHSTGTVPELLQV